MSDGFQVSVIIPVFRAEKFIADAVQRVLSQPEVAEVILMEDGSPDGSLQKCQEIAARYGRVKLFTHENGVNRGAGETRNAAIQRSTCDFVAFADADNMYLPDRFKRDKELFAADPTIDGVYNAQGIHYENDAARKKFVSGGLAGGEFLSVSGPVPPDELLSVMFGRHRREQMIGGLGIDAITLHRRCFEKAGMFEKTLRLQQDVHFFFKLAASCRMHAGILDKPVALRGVHADMRSTDPKIMIKYRRMRWRLVNEWIQKNVSSVECRTMASKAYTDFRIRDSAWGLGLLQFAKSVLYSPRECLTEYGRFDQNFSSLFGNGRAVQKTLSAKNRFSRVFSNRTHSTNTN